jgi:Family of unknown function (DUF6328)
MTPASVSATIDGPLSTTRGNATLCVVTSDPYRDAKGTGNGTDGDDDDERLDRELIELLNELRVVLPGVQVLFAFLLTVAFTTEFGKASSTDRTVYFIAFAATTVASIFLIAPSAQHRVRFRRHDKENLIRWSNRYAISGIASVGVAIGAVVFLITDRLYGTTEAIIGTSIAVAFLVAIWFAYPIGRAATRDE